MKAFHFRLEQALRWREQQLRLEQALLAVSAAKVITAKAARADAEMRTLQAARDLTAAGAEACFYSYEGFRRTSKKKADALLQLLKSAEMEYAGRMAGVVEASRRVRLLEKLRDNDRKTWHLEADKEVADFAGEAFLMRHAALRRTEARSAAALRIAAPDGTIEERMGA